MKTLQELADLTQAELFGDPAYGIASVDELSSAGPLDCSFLSNPLYRPLLAATQAGAICIDPATPRLEGKNYLVSEKPSETFQIIVKLFLPPKISGFSGIHPSAVIHPLAQIGPGVSIGPNAVIDQEAIIGERTSIGASCFIGAGAIIGSNCLIHPNATIREGCILQDRVILQSGVVIGSCGYGYATNAQGVHVKQEQLGIVVLEDDVEVGANTTIDRARFKETRICKGTKIDNLVQIGHNCRIGPYNLIVAQTGISGSVKTGRYVVMGGQTGTVGHIAIADGAMFAARSGIKKSIKKGGKYGGSPAISLDAHNREQVYLKQVPDIVRKLKKLFPSPSGDGRELV